jgi:hypothetical protein
LRRLHNLKNSRELNNIIFEASRIFSLLERKLNENNVVEEYCWAITQAAGGHAAAVHYKNIWI